MGRNVEVKVKVDDAEAVRSRIERLADTGPEVLLQDDTFFPARRGRLKLRSIDGGRAELIAYDRPDGTGARTSRYAIHPVDDPGSLRSLLAGALGTTGRVRKRRVLYRIGPTRVHLDEVEGLGHFLELEVVMRPGQTDEEGAAVARELLAALEIPPSADVPVAYIDLLAPGKAP